MREQLQRLLGSLTFKAKIKTAAIALAVGAGLYLLVQDHRERDFRPLYTALAAEDASQVVSKLKASGVDYRLAENGSTVLVRSARVADARLLVAGAGLPKTGRMGFELFDKTNFGASDFTEQVNYRRALEGELERSIMALSEVEQARVHLTFPKDSIFTESRQPAKASVLLKLRAGAKLAPQNVLAVGHLVSSAVEGLSPEGVSVVDMQGNLLSRRLRPGGAEGSEMEGGLEYRQRFERDVLAKIYATVEPVLGSDHFRAGVSAEVDLSSGEQSEESWDPNRSVMVTQQRTEEMNSPASASGVPGTASSLPRPTSRPGASGSGLTRRTENITYQSSRMMKRTKVPQGAIRRISVSAIVDQEVRWEGTGAKAKRILEPPSEEKLKKVRDLVAGAIGFNQERGDQIIVQSLPFEATLRLPPPEDPAARRPPASAPLPFGLDKVQPAVLIGAAAGVVVLLVALTLLASRMLRGNRKKAGAKVEGLPALAERETHPHALAEAEAASGKSLEQKLEARLAEQAAQREKAELAALDSLKLPMVQTKKSEVLVKHIAEEAKRDPPAVAQLLRSWISQKERP